MPVGAGLPLTLSGPAVAQTSCLARLSRRRQISLRLAKRVLRLDNENLGIPSRPGSHNLALLSAKRPILFPPGLKVVLLISSSLRLLQSSASNLSSNHPLLTFIGHAPACGFLKTPKAVTIFFKETSFLDLDCLQIYIVHLQQSLSERDHRLFLTLPHISSPL